MKFPDMIKMRRSVYALNKNLPVSKNRVFDIIQDAVKYVPDAFDMKSQRVLVLFGKKHELFWNDVFNTLVKTTGKNISPDKINSFQAGFGTILYFYDSDVVKSYKKQFSLYSKNFNNWAMQSNAMLQFAIWTALAGIHVGASLQHYNPIIDNMVHQNFDIPKNWVLVAQMPFGGIANAPQEKPDYDITPRIKTAE